MQMSEFVKKVLREEGELLSELALRKRLLRLLCDRRQLARFAKSFYFVRYGFYRLNFIVGARSGPDETFWSGLVLNLAEELGGFRTPTHNALYRSFLSEAGISSEKGLLEPRFAALFNRRWEHFCAKAAFAEALAGIAVYEVLDQPDYALLLEVMKNAGVGRKGLHFFEVHAQARHFDLFEGSMSQLWKSPKGREALRKAACFVNKTQRMMWDGLLRHLEAKPRRPHLPARSPSLSRRPRRSLSAQDASTLLSA
jgi:hypothetical protein